MSRPDPVRRFLAQRGSPQRVVQGGLAGLVADWERIAGQIEAGYPLGLDDYLDDMDARQLIERALPLAPAAGRAPAEERVARADARVRAHVRAVKGCLWGPRVAASEGWIAEVNWWYFAVPTAPGPLLREELGRRGRQRRG